MNALAALWDLPQSSEDMALSPTDNGSHHHHHHHHQTVLMNGTNGTEAPSQPQPAAPRAVHFQVPLSSLPSSTKEVVGKSSLRRSKSFSHEEPANACFPAEYQSLVKKAMHGQKRGVTSGIPNSRQLTESDTQIDIGKTDQGLISHFYCKKKYQ
ncbi:hypothetical protein HPB51_016180 [Rhipicephalus microplus]|uniref:Uncharacterized protein n=1 Tax=Rhipicephalus microplus TaxID=6941 RepID=A0A9J6E2H8_RHIMP|nr:hypothetical protein HPB51_016180 [Rhipicephalus microplus]